MSVRHALRQYATPSIAAPAPADQRRLQNSKAARRRRQQLQDLLFNVEVRTSSCHIDINWPSISHRLPSRGVQNRACQFLIVASIPCCQFNSRVRAGAYYKPPLNHEEHPVDIEGEVHPTGVNAALWSECIRVGSLLPVPSVSFIHAVDRGDLRIVVSSGRADAIFMPADVPATTEGMSEEAVEERSEDKLEWKLVPFSRPGSVDFVQVQKSAKRVFAGAGARVLFYPTLLYNVVRNRFQPEFRWWDEIDQFLLLGAVPFPGDVLPLKAIGVRAVVTLTESYETLVPTTMYQNQGIEQLVIPTRDYLFAPSIGDIRRAVAFIHGHVQHGQTTYVHCKAGRGRSTTVVLCYLVEHRGMNPSDAFQYVRGKRPRVLLATAQWQAVQEYSEQVRLRTVPRMPLKLEQWLPSSRGRNASLEPVNGLSNAESGTAVGSNELRPLDIEELPVIISSVDLSGYRSIEDAGLIGNALCEELGVVYRVRFMAARSVVHAVRVARASMEWARLSCLVMGCQTDNNQVVGSHSQLRVEGFHSSEGIALGKSMTTPVLLAEQIAIARLNLPVCPSGMVNG